MYRTAGKHTRFALMAAVPETTCPAAGKDRPQHWSNSEQPGPFPTQLCLIPAPGWAPCALPVPRTKAAPAWGKMLPSCPPSPALPCLMSLSQRWKAITRRAVSHPMGTVSLEVAQPAPSPPPTPQAGPCPSPADIHAWHPPVTLQPPQCLLPLLPGHRDIALGPSKPQTQSCGRELPQTALRENHVPVPATIPAGLHVPGAAA